LAANQNPIFTITPHIASASIATANTGRDGTGTLGAVITGTTNGTRVDRVTIHATGTTTAGMIRFFIDDGSTIRIIYEVSVTAATPSGTVQAFGYEWVRTDTLPLLVLPNTYVLRAGTNNSETFIVTAYGGDY
jgi:hypothetical protein